MRIVYYKALFIFFTVLPQPPDNQNLIDACKKGDKARVQQIFSSQCNPTLEALRAALDNKHLDVAQLFLEHKTATILVQKKLFKQYCRPGLSDVAEWLLRHGKGTPYQADCLYEKNS